MTLEIVFASLLLAAIAAMGVLRPFGSTRHAQLERLADPLEDERLSLLRSLRDLDQERATGELADETYRALRSETETRAVAVLRALEARDGAGELSAGLRELRGSPSGNGARGAAGAAPRGRRMVVTALAAAGVTAIVVALLVAAVKGRSPGAPITGVNVGASASANPLAFFEQRVRDHPNDVAARLDLAERYLETSNAQGAIAQYLVALQLDPRNAEAHANLGLVLFRAKPQDALDAENQALRTDPNYAEAMYFKGVILLQGLNRPAEAVDAFQAYLKTAPFGSYRSEVQSLLQQAEAQAKR